MPVSSVLARTGSALAASRGALVAGASILRNPTDLAVTAKTTVTPAYTVYPFAPSPPPPPPSRWSIGGLVMSLFRPSMELGTPGQAEVVAIEPWGDPDELPLQPLVAAGVVVAVGLACYGAYRLIKG